MRTRTRARAHRLLLVPNGDHTLGACTCGEWRREVTTETVAITGRSREDALRSAHAEHARS